MAGKGHNSVKPGTLEPCSHTEPPQGRWSPATGDTLHRDAGALLLVTHSTGTLEPCYW
ncbi:UNVERIFIED_CONTAM: hypothetical protein FKN15_053600 [Acipenser sinensis]